MSNKQKGANLKREIARRGVLHACVQPVVSLVTQLYMLMTSNSTSHEPHICTRHRLCMYSNYKPHIATSNLLSMDHKLFPESVERAAPPPSLPSLRTAAAKTREVRCRAFWSGYSWDHLWITKSYNNCSEVSGSWYRSSGLAVTEAMCIFSLL